MSTRFKFYSTLTAIPLDLIAIGLAFVQSYLFRYDFLTNLGFSDANNYFVSFSDYMDKLWWISIPAFISLVLFKHYQLKTETSILFQVKLALYSALFLNLTIITYYFLARVHPPSRLVVFYYCGFFFLNVVVMRLISALIKNKLLDYGIGKINTLIIGSGITAQKVIASIYDNKQYKVIGYVAPKKNEALGQTKWLGDYLKLENIAKKYKVENLIHATNSSKIPTDSTLTIARNNHMEYQYIPANYAIHKHNFHISNLQGIPWLEWKKTPLAGWGRVYKRIFDIIGATIGIIIVSPVFIVTAIVIKLTSKGPILFRLDDGEICKRVGAKGKLFTFLKFRSMRYKTHAKRYNDLSKNNKRTGPLVKIENDPRITKVGKFIRRFDIDELPQLFNVLKGDMSLVGPRPHLPEEVSKYDQDDRFVLTIKPGMTGLAQVSGRSNLSFKDEITLDSYYIEHWSLLLDFKIILKTIPAVLKSKSD
jgi:exopolysaccharide biosynthesis polyprenyl glycosylphosphotransferase